MLQDAREYEILEIGRHTSEVYADLKTKLALRYLPNATRSARKRLRRRLARQFPGKEPASRRERFMAVLSNHSKLENAANFGQRNGTNRGSGRAGFAKDHLIQPFLETRDNPEPRPIPTAVVQTRFRFATTAPSPGYSALQPSKVPPFDRRCPLSPNPAKIGVV